MDFVERFVALGPYLGATLIATAVAALLWQGRRETPGRTYFAVLMGAVAVWALLNFWEDATGPLEAKLFWANAQYFFIGAVPVLFFQFTLRSTVDPLPPPWGELRWRIALWVLPAAIGVLVWFDPWWSLVRRIEGLTTVAGFTVIQKTWSPLFWVHAAYGYVLTGASLLLWGRYVFRGLKTVRWPEYLPFLAGFLPWGANLAYLAGFNPWPGHDPTTAAFAITGLVLAVAQGRSRVFTQWPAAQEVLMEAWPGPLLIVDRRFRLRFFNAPAARTWGLVKAQLDADLRRLRPWMGEGVDPEESTVARWTDEAHQRIWEVEGRPLRIDRGSRGLLLIFRDVTGTVREASDRTQALERAYLQINTAFDIQRRTEEQIFFYSLHDSLTGLANRSLLLSRLAQTMDSARQPGGAVYALVGVDLVHFRGVNEAHGFRLGDLLIRETARRLVACLRDTDVVARINADRFYAVLNGTRGLDTVLATVARMREAVEEPLRLGNQTYLPQARFAVVEGDPQSPSPEAVIDDAEITLARLKAQTGGEVLVFERWWREQREEDRVLLADLSRAFSTRQIRLVYQPIVAAADGRLLGVEALIRWQHPTLGPINPSRMVSLAEAEGLISPLGLWTLKEATSLLGRLTRDEPALAEFYVSVNVSPQQLLDPDFSAIVLALLEGAGVAPSQLHLEITETSVVLHSERVVPQLQALRSTGIQVKLDDFGTGYSSLHSLHELPIDALKIDRSFVTKLPQSQAIVATVLDLARKLNMDSVAEGVETEAQRRLLVAMGCGQFQGFLFSAGLSEAELRTRLTEEIGSSGR